MSKRVHVLIGANNTSAIIGFYLGDLKIRQCYMMEKVPIKSWLPDYIKYWERECHAKVTVSRTV